MSENQENKLLVYPVPQGAILQKDYILKVRPAGETSWTEVKTYRVKVDMHDVRYASMAYFDFSGSIEVEITFPRFYTVYRVDIRPLALGIVPVIEPKRVTFKLDKPADLSIEINRERFHNLHIFAGAIEEAPDKHAKNTLIVKGALDRPGFVGDEMNRKIESMEKGRLVYIEAGIHYIGECIWHLPSHTRIYLEGGAILIGALVCDHAEDIRIFGKGMLYLAGFERFSSINGMRLSHSQNISVEGVMFINPPHYTVYLGDCKNVTLSKLKSFSCEGWSDGIDMMGCQNVVVDGGFLRTSDDCIAIYGSRWDNRGGSRNITVKNISVWADVAHPLMVGIHGAHEEDGDVIEDILFDNIDILEHHEYQAEYLGAMAINAGDKNIVRNVTYSNIRIEPFEHGKVLDIQIKWNHDYNPAPGKKIQGICFNNIYVYTGPGEETSVIDGYDKEAIVEDCKIENFYRDGKKVDNFKEANIYVGDFTKNILIGS